MSTLTDRAGVLTVHGIGAGVSICADGPRSSELELALATAWSRCLEPGEAPVRDAGTVRLWLTGPGEAAPDELSRTGSGLASDDLAALLSTGTQAITHALLRAQIGSLLLLHAGAVTHPVTGQSLVFVAEGGIGKTTLACTLGAHYGYLTDETVGIGAAGGVLAYPKPLSLRTDAGRPKAETSPDALGLLPAHPKPTVAQVVVLVRDARAAVPRVRQLGLLDAIAAITPQSSSLYALPRGLHWCADLIRNTAPVLEVTYAEAGTLIPLAEQWIGAA